MCLVAFALNQSSRFPFVLASNRDEFYERPAAQLEWWEPEGGGPAILGGRDLLEGGTWLGLTASGRLGLVTNVRNLAKTNPQAPSRGHIATQWLKDDTDMGHLWPRLATAGYNGYNMVALDFAKRDFFWLNNEQREPKRLHDGLFGLSNAELDTPWPKVKALTTNLASAVCGSVDAGDLATRLFAALADPNQANDEELPHTGVPYEWEKKLSSVFIREPGLRYGTRSSMVIVTERVKQGWNTHVMERTFTSQPSTVPMRRVTLKNWPIGHMPCESSAVVEQRISDLSA